MTSTKPLPGLQSATDSLLGSNIKLLNLPMGVIKGNSTHFGLCVQQPSALDVPCSMNLSYRVEHQRSLSRV
jgi:hypothetical protein